MKPIQFNMQQSKEFYAKLKSEVNNYFTTHNKSDKGDRRLYTKTIVLLTSWVGLYIGILLLWDMSIRISVLGYILFGLVGALIGFNVMHDGGHGGYSNNKTLNKIMWYTMNLLGSDIFLRQVQHNVLHHTYTNIEGYDDDIDTRPVFRFHPEQKLEWYHRFQHIYALFLYGLSTIVKMFYLDFKRYFTSSVGQFKYKKMSLLQHIIFWLTKWLMFTVYIIIPAYFIGWGYMLLGLVLMYFVMGIFLAVVFQLAHVLEDTAMPMHVDYKIEEHRAVHEIVTTANFATKNKFLTRLLGGLNYQIEHHLFPRVSHIHYPQIAKIVKSVCKEYHIPYQEYKTMTQAFFSHMRYIKKMGRTA